MDRQRPTGMRFSTSFLQLIWIANHNHPAICFCGGPDRHTSDPPAFGLWVLARETHRGNLHMLSLCGNLSDQKFTQPRTIQHSIFHYSKGLGVCLIGQSFSFIKPHDFLKRTVGVVYLQKMTSISKPDKFGRGKKFLISMPEGGGYQNISFCPE